MGYQVTVKSYILQECREVGAPFSYCFQEPCAPLGELQSHGIQKLIGHREHRESLVFTSLCPLCSLWLHLSSVCLLTLQFSCVLRQID